MKKFSGKNRLAVIALAVMIGVAGFILSLIHILLCRR